MKRLIVQRAAASCGILVLLPLLLAQQPGAPPPPGAQPSGQTQLLSPQQLDDLVAPIALYPDQLLSQVLVASTYPLEVVEAQQWLQQNRNLQGQALLDAAKAQNWDPSVQALVAFPDVLMRLNSDINWTTQLGNAFLAQQADVMNAVQRMRQRAEANGKLQSNAQERVVTQTQNGQQAVEIQPANPDVVYVPVYNPVYVWGPPVWGYYPPLWYPGIGVGFTWGPGIYVGAFFGGWAGWGWGGWGWGPDWFGHTIIVNNSFFHRFGFRDFHGGYRGTEAWAHDPMHRLGVPYANRGVAERYHGFTAAQERGFRAGAAESFNRGIAERSNERFGAGERSAGGQRFGSASPGQRFGKQGFEQHNFSAPHSAFGGIHNGGATRFESDHGFSTFHGGGFGGARAGGGFGGGRVGGGGHFGGGRR